VTFKTRRQSQLFVEFSNLGHPTSDHVRGGPFYHRQVQQVVDEMR
jgi:hypothetical protein